MRNLAVHNAGPVSPEMAREFLSLSDAVLFTIASDSKGYRPLHTRRLPVPPAGSATA
jgi:hypothetical protein